MKASIPCRNVTLFLDCPDGMRGQMHITDDAFRSLWIESSALSQTVRDALSKEDSAKRRIARERLERLISGFEHGMNRVLR